MMRSSILGVSTMLNVSIQHLPLQSLFWTKIWRAFRALDSSSRIPNTWRQVARELETRRITSASPVCARPASPARATCLHLVRYPARCAKGIFPGARDLLRVSSSREILSASPVCARPATASPARYLSCARATCLSCARNLPLLHSPPISLRARPASPAGATCLHLASIFPGARKDQ